MFCENCGQKVNKGDRHCPHCAHDLREQWLMAGVDLIEEEATNGSSVQEKSHREKKAEEDVLYHVVPPKKAQTSWEATQKKLNKHAFEYDLSEEERADIRLRPSYQKEQDEEVLEEAIPENMIRRGEFNIGFFWGILIIMAGILCGMLFAIFLNYLDHTGFLTDLWNEIQRIFGILFP